MAFLENTQVQEQFEVPTPQVDDPPKKKKLWDYMTKKQLYTKSYEDFDTQFSTPERVGKLYNFLVEKKQYTKSQDDFTAQFFADDVKKKEPTQPQQQIQQPIQETKVTETITPNSTKVSETSTSGAATQVPTSIPSPFVGNQVEQPKEEDVIELSKQADELSRQIVQLPTGGTMMGSSMMDVPDENAIAQSKELKAKIKQQGYDADELNEAFKDFPEQLYNTDAYSKKKLLELNKTNKNDFYRTVATAKGQYGLLSAIKAIPKDDPRRKMGENDFNAFVKMQQTPKTYDGGRLHTRSTVDMVYKYVEDADERDKILAYLGKDLENSYDPRLKGAKEALQNDPRKKYLNNNELLGLQYYEDINPSLARTFDNVLVDKTKLDTNGFETVDKGEILGLQQQKQKLAVQGLSIKMNQLNEDISAIAAKGNNVSEQERKELENLTTQYKAAEEELKDLTNPKSKEYGKLAEYNLDGIAQELFGQRHGLAVNQGLKFMSGVGGTVGSAIGLVSEPFRSEEGSKVANLGTIGQGIKSNKNTYTVQDNTLLKQFDIQETPEFTQRKNEILNNPNLSYEEKIKQGIELLGSNDGWKLVPPTEELNMGVMPIIYSFSDVANGLAQFMLTSTVLRGVPALNASSKGSQFLNSFSSTFLQNFQPKLTANLTNNEESPTAKAFLSATIDGILDGAVDKVGVIKKMFTPNSSIGKVINQLSDAELENIIKQSNKGNLFQDILQGALSSAKNTLPIAASSVGSMVATDYINNDLKKAEDYLKEGLVQQAMFMLLGLPSGAMGKRGQRLDSKKVAQEMLQKRQEVDPTFKPYVQMPSEVEKQREGEVITTQPTEYTPETKKSGVSIILPKPTEGEVITTKPITEKVTKSVKQELPKEESRTVAEPTKVSESSQTEKERYREQKMKEEGLMLELLPLSLEETVSPERKQREKEVEENNNKVKARIKEIDAEFDAKETVKVEQPTVQENAALKDVESTAKALEGKDISTKISTTLKEINHFSDNENFEFDKNKGAWFTTDKSGYVRRPNAKTKISRYIDEKSLNLATEKQAFLAGDGNFEKGVKELEKQGYDGVKTKNNNSTEYYIFDVNKTKNRQELISEAYHADKAAGKETELVKAVESLLSKEQTTKTEPTVQETKTTVEEVKPIEKKKVSQSLRDKAKQVREQGVNKAFNLPEAKLPDGTQQAGFGGKSLNEAIAKSLEIVADAMDAGKEILDAAKEGFENIKAYYKENAKSFDEAKLKDQFIDNISENKQQAEQLKNSWEKKVTVIQPDTAAKNAELERVRSEFELDEFAEKDKVTTLERQKTADDTVNKWKEEGTYQQNIDAIFGRVAKKEASVNDQEILTKHLADLRVTAKSMSSKDRYSSKYDEISTEIKRTTDALRDIGSIFGSGMQARKGFVRGEVVESIVDVEQDMMDALRVDVLTEEQKKQAEERFKVIEETEKKYEEILKERDVEIERLKAENEMLELAKQNTKNTPAKRKKTKEDYVKEREEIKNSIKEKLKESRGKMNSVVTAAVDFAKITPDVVKLIGSYLEEGAAISLDGVRKLLRKDLAEMDIDVTDQELNKLIAGEYAERKKVTRTALIKKRFEIIEEQKLLNEIATLESGQTPKTDAQKTKINQRLKELREKIEQLKKSMGVGKYSDEARFQASLKQRIAANEKQIEQINDDIKNKRFSKEDFDLGYSADLLLKKENKELYDKWIDIVNKKWETKLQYQKELIADAEKNQSLIQKLYGAALKAHDTGKGTKAMFDQSVLLVQLIGYSLSHPKNAVSSAVRALRYDIVNAKSFKEKMALLHNSKLYELAEQFKLAIYEPRSAKAELRSELHGGEKNLWNKEFTIQGKKYSVGQAFERASTSIINDARLQMFEKGVENLMINEKLPETHPKEYEALARRINEWTAHGKVASSLEKISTVTSWVIWSMKMMASTLNVLGVGDLVRPVGTIHEMGRGLANTAIGKKLNFPTKEYEGAKGFYTSLTPTQRKAAAIEFGRAAIMGITILSVAKITGSADDVDLDPYSSTFGSMKSGDKTINVYGRYAGMVRTIFQLIAGEKHSYYSGDKKVTDLDKDAERMASIKKGRMGVLYGSTFRGKMTPFAGYMHDKIFLNEKNYYTNEEVDWFNDLIVPMGIQDIKKDFERDEPLMALAGTLFKFYGGNLRDRRATQFKSSKSSTRGTTRGTTNRGSSRGTKRSE